MTRPKRKTRKSRGRNPQPKQRGEVSNKPFSHGYVFVHGVGRQRRGQTLSMTGRRVTNTLKAVLPEGEIEELPDLRRELNTPDHRAIRLKTAGSSSDVLFVEATWFQAFKSIGGNGSISGTFWYLVRIPFIVLLALFPNRQDSVELTAWNEGATNYLVPWKLAPNFALLSFAWRVTGLAVFTLAAVSVTRLLSEAHGIVWALSGWAVIAGMLVAGAMRYAAPHVKVAVASQTSRHELLRSIRTSVQFAEHRCESISLVGHSQGGYLAYEFLRSEGGNHPSIVRLIGVGSGLKPIVMLQSLENKFVLRYTLGALLGTSLMGFGFWWMLQPGGFLDSTFASHIVRISQTLMVSSVAAGAAIFKEGIGIPGAGSLLPAPVAYLSVLPMIVGSAVILISVARRDKILLESPSIENPLRRNKCFEWYEFATRHDVVARVGFPELPEAVMQREVPTRGNAVRDHLLQSYFGSRRGPVGVLTLALAEKVLFDCGATSKAKRWGGIVAQWTEDLVYRTERGFKLRTTCFATSAFLFVIYTSLFIGVPVTRALASFWPIILVVDVVVAIIIIFMTMKRFRSTGKRQFQALVGSAAPSVPPRFVQNRLHAFNQASLATISVAAFGSGLALTNLQMSSPPGYSLVLYPRSISSALVGIGLFLGILWSFSTAGYKIHWAILPMCAAYLFSVIGQTTAVATANKVSTLVIFGLPFSVITLALIIASAIVNLIANARKYPG